MAKIRVERIEVVPDGEYCYGCRFLENWNMSCHLFNVWYYVQRIMDYKKCIACIEATVKEK